MKTYKHNELNIAEFSADKLRFVWWDAAKNGVPANAFNAGFFGYFSAPGMKNYTLPVGNIVCDKGVSEAYEIGSQQAADIRSWGGEVGDKIKLNCNQNVSPQFKRKTVSTLVITNDNLPFVFDIDKIPACAKYAVSGVPVIRDGIDVSWSKYVTAQGWKSDPMYGTKRNWIGVKFPRDGTGDCTCVLIWGATASANYISTSELYNKIKTLGIRDLISLDGGGSYINTVGGNLCGGNLCGGTDKTAENRRINNIGVIAQ